MDEDWEKGKEKNVADPSEIIEHGGRILCRVEEKGKVADEIEAYVVPVHTTLDPNVNGQTQIVRCPIDVSVSPNHPPNHPYYPGSECEWTDAYCSLSYRGKRVYPPTHSFNL